MNRKTHLAIIILAVVAGAIGGYLRIQSTTAPPLVVTATPAATGPQTGTAGVPPPSPVAVESASRYVDAGCTSGVEAYNATYTLTPPSEAPTSNWLLAFAVPYNTTATYYYSVETNNTGGAVAASIVDGLIAYTAWGNSTVSSPAPVNTTGTLGPGIYEFQVSDLPLNHYTSRVTSEFKLTYKPTSQTATCGHTSHTTAEATLWVSPTSTSTQSWSYPFFVPNNTVGSVTIDYTSNTSLGVSITQLLNLNGTVYPNTLTPYPYTNTHGNITFTDLEPGIYVIQLQALSTAAATVQVEVTATYHEN